MSKIKYIALASVLTFSIAACNENRNSATLGNSTDTTNVEKGGSETSSHDTAKSSGTDSTVHGNANPTGQMGGDTTKRK
ncbi:hypothetical protein [Mucilaginibacter jinjuensis]|uniref:Lipoprotein n=1 Tax=Mucilaginibacter jinjuensis TaxID=1176721 RepID=A0ABY7T6Q1_9SPHI|nr:hypothetical protein [Mucilaginibacter jinjuensis]WCT11944.1 hypothetical protein PQO05_24740 [Mucilaginibacter jinjuensis]